jgi:hypothetical protein
MLTISGATSPVTSISAGHGKPSPNSIRSLAYCWQFTLLLHRGNRTYRKHKKHWLWSRPYAFWIELKNWRNWNKLKQENTGGTTSLSLPNNFILSYIYWIRKIVDVDARCIYLYPMIIFFEKQIEVFFSNYQTSTVLFNHKWLLYKYNM